MSEKNDFLSKRRKHAKIGTDPVLLAIGQQLRERRSSLCMTQSQLALVTNVGREFIIRLENGHPGCAIGDVSRIVQALGLKITLVPSHE